MSIDERQVRDLERLAGLSLDRQERSLFGEHLGKILAFMQRLGEVDTGGVEPATSSLEQVCPRRPDRPRPSLSPAEAVAAAPASRDGYFVVPPVLPDGADE